jgi:very-short-patch-repair endonuclease
MGYKEAKEDNIKTIINEHSKNTQYYPRCACCGKEVMSLNYIKGYKYLCKACKLNNYLSDKENRTENNKEIKEAKLKKAIERISKHTYNIEKYKKSIQTIEKYLHRDGWFDSTEEIMVAIELCKNKIKFNHQVKFGRYRVDFLLPDEKVILEVDGTMFHTAKTREKEQIRDNLIVLNLGAEWEIIRITDEDINKNITKLAKAIHKVKAKREELRKEYNGKLPEWYSNKST